MERNQFLEMDGLYWESDTHEWFNDKSCTDYAEREDITGVSLKELKVFVVRNKATGEYDRVLMDRFTNEILYHNKSLEVFGSHIDTLRVAKRFN